MGHVFWLNDPELWFQQDDTKYVHIVGGLDSATTHRLIGLPQDLPNAEKYGALKKEFLQRYQLVEMDRASRLLSLTGF